MSKVHYDSSLIRALTMLLLLSSVLGCAAQKRIQPSTYSQGAQYYRTLCASCHGAEGHGDGPVAATLKKTPPDLTTITQRYNGHFPTEYVWQTIDGRAMQAAHGAREMPVWGRALYYSHEPMNPDARAAVEMKVNELVSYLRSLQR